MIRTFVLSAACAAFLVATGANAQTQAPAAKVAAKSAQPAAAATQTVKVTPAQLEIASRVLTGDAQCEFDQRVGVHPIEGKPGHFKVSFKNVTYTMVPQETTTGAVRLEDKKAGVVWIQIPAKSMLLNGKVGQRMVDACTQKGQRT